MQACSIFSKKKIRSDFFFLQVILILKISINWKMKLSFYEEEKKRILPYKDAIVPMAQPSFCL